LTQSSGDQEAIEVADVLLASLGPFSAQAYGENVLCRLRVPESMSADMNSPAAYEMLRFLTAAPSVRMRTEHWEAGTLPASLAGCCRELHIVHHGSTRDRALLELPKVPSRLEKVFIEVLLSPTLSESYRRLTGDQGDRPFPLSEVSTDWHDRVRQLGLEVSHSGLVPIDVQVRVARGRPTPDTDINHPDPFMG